MRSLSIVAAAAAFVLSFPQTPAGATPLDGGGWTLVGKMSAGGGMFNGNCNLAAGCSYGPDAAGDFWSGFGTFPGQQILFITGDRTIWALADYDAVYGVVAAGAGVFPPNVHWLDAGLNGASLGSGVVGNILFRPGVGEDPWVTLRGPHCAHLISDSFPSANDCNLIIWGEVDWVGWAGAVHPALKNASGGVEVYVSNADNDGDSVLNGADACPATEPGAVVLPTGCSLAQLAPCGGPWKNHGQYVSAVAEVSRAFVDAGLMTSAERGAAIAEAARSSCGK